MADNKLELVVEVDANKANASIKTINTGLSSIEQTAAKSARGATAGIDGMTAAMVKGATAGTILAHAFEKVVGWVKQYTVESAMLAARNETLAVVNQQLATANGHQGDSIERLVKRIQTLGITTQAARDTVNKMIAAQLDLSKATDLARLAQDAAVVAGENSSQALQGIMHGITTQQIEVLRTYGINVTFEREFAAARQRLGRDLTDLERKNIALQRVLAESSKIAGAYEASLGTVGKQLSSLERYVEEARAAIGERFLPEMRQLISAMTDVAKWAKDNADAIALWAKGIAAAALGVAVGKFIAWVAGAKKAVDALTVALARNPLTAVAIAATVAGTALYEMHQDSLELEKRLKEQNKTADETRRIFYQIERGKTVDELKAMGYSVAQLRSAFLGAREGADEFMTAVDNQQFGLRITVINEKELAELRKRQQEELARDIGKRQRDVERETLDAARTAERAMLSGPGRALMEIAEKAAKASVFVDSTGVEHEVRLTHATIENLEREHQAKVLVMQRESIQESVALSREEYKARLQYETDVYQRRLAHDQEIATSNLEHVRTLYELEERRADVGRDDRMRSIEAQEARTIEQKIWVEQQKMAVEVDYLERVHEIRQRMFDAETSQRVLDYELEMKRLGYRSDEIQRRIAEYTEQRQQIREANDEATDAAIQAARENAANRTASIIRDHNQRIFDSLKQQAGGVFDALLTKSQSVWAAIGNSFKTAMLTAIKEVVTSRVAVMLMGLFGARSGGGGYAPDGVARGGGWATAMGGFGAIFAGGSGSGGFGGGPIPGGMGGGWSTPPFLGGGSGGFGGSSGGGGMFSPGNWSGMLGNLKEFAGIGGSIQTGAGMATTWGAASMGQKLSALGRSNAALLGGSLLAMEGLRRGGWSGLGMTTAGGALIGFKFGGGLGAAIGAAVGFGAGLVRMFVKGAQEKAREKIKATYGVDIPDKGLLKQIVDTAKSAFGGNLDLAIRSPQVREIIELYAMSTGQKATGLPGRATATALVQSGGSMYEAATFSNGSPLPSSVGFDTIGAGRASNAPPVAISLNIDGRAVGEAVLDKGRVVVRGALSAMKGNAGRREMAALQMSPGTIVS